MFNSKRPALLALLLAALPRAGGAQQSVDVTKMGYDRGMSGAPILVVEFADFGCSACGQFARDVWPELQREFVATGRVRWKYVPFILGMFPNGDEAVKAAECAADQDAFWSMHDLLFQRQKEWNRLKDPGPKFAEFAGALSLDTTVFGRCYETDGGAERTKQNDAAAKALMVRSTPTFFVNGQRALGALPIAEWRKIFALVEGRGTGSGPGTGSDGR
ncbi:MAG: thioredoxin domain-containing protein [Gemmatimonadota bacterium]|jgi:protein-disulfide isomerase